MVRIPERPYAALARGQVEYRPEGSGSVSRALSSLGADALNLAENLRARREHDLLVEAQSRYASKMGAWRDKEEKEKTGGSAEGHALRLLRQHGEAAEAALERLNEAGAGEAGARAFRAWAGEREKKGFMQAAAFEHRQLLRHGQELHETRLREITAELERDPQAFADSLRQAEESYALAVGQGVLAPGEAAAAFARTREALGQTAFSKLYASSPDRAIAGMAALGLPEEQQAVLRTRHEADAVAAARLAAAAKKDASAALAMRIPDAERQALLDGGPAGLEQLARAFADINDLEAAREAGSRAELHHRHAPIIGESLNMSLPELSALIARKKEESAQAASDGQPDETGRDKERRAEELSLLLSMYDTRKRALVADPAESVGKEVAAALGLDSGEPALMPGEEAGLPTSLTAERLADLRMAAQGNQGLGPEERRVLTNKECAAYRESWRSGDAAGRLRTALSLTAYGKHTGAVSRELGLRPAEQLVLLQVGADPRAAVSLAAVIEANTAGYPAMRETPQDDGRTLQAAIESSEVARAARAATRALPGIPALRSSFDNYRKTLAGLLRMEGGDMDSAVAMLDGRLRSLVTAGCALLYDPVVHGDAGFLENALERAKMKLIAEGGPGRAQAERLSGSGEKGVWINAPDADGFVFREPDSATWTLHVRESDLRELAVAGPAA